MSGYLAAAQFVAGFANAGLKKRAGYKTGYDIRRAARESLLTAKWNIAEATNVGKYEQFTALNAGGNAIKDIAIAGVKAGGTASVSSGTSGAVDNTGSTRQASDSIVREALNAQTEIFIETKRQIKAIAVNTDNQNRSEWRNALLNSEQQNRKANNVIDAANNEFVANMLQTSVKAGGTAASGSTGSKTASAVNIASDFRSATGGKGDSSMTASPYDQRGIKRTRQQIFSARRKNRMNTASIYQNRRLYGK